MAEVIDNIYVQDDFFIPYEPYSEDPANLRRLTKIFTSSDLLERADIAITTILAALVQHTKPQAAQSTLTVPLYDLVPLPDFITFIQQQIFAEEVAFPIVAERLLHNAARASDIDPAEYERKETEDRARLRHAVTPARVSHWYEISRTLVGTPTVRHPQDDVGRARSAVRQKWPRENATARRCRDIFAGARPSGAFHHRQPWLPHRGHGGSRDFLDTAQRPARNPRPVRPRQHPVAEFLSTPV